MFKSPKPKVLWFWIFSKTCNQRFFLYWKLKPKVIFQNWRTAQHGSQPLILNKLTHPLKALALKHPPTLASGLLHPATSNPGKSPGQLCFIFGWILFQNGKKKSVVWGF
jgi:hypothetical protein